MKKYLFVLLFSFCSLFGSISNAQTLTQTNLPIVLITSTNTIDVTQVQGNMSIINNTSGINQPTDVPQFQGMIGIKLRGSSTNPKRSYNIETWINSSGSSLNTFLLGMPSENDWVLLACYTDRSLMRDLLGLYLYQQMGNYAPRMQLVEVMLNNTYQGVYLLGEKIKRDVNRIDLSTLQLADNTAPEITGGYIFKIDNSTSDFWTSQIAPPNASGSQNIKFYYEEPSATSITPVQKAYIKSYMDSFENALNANNFQDTLVGWRKFAAKSSFQEYLITTELLKSVDAYRLSAYLYKDKSKKLRMGPPWDLELSLYNTANCAAAEDTGWAYDFASHCAAETFLPPFWWKKLTSDTTFMREAKCKYTVYRNSILDTTKIWAFMDSISTRLNAQQAQQRNFQKWPIWGTSLVNEPAPVSTNYSEEISKLKGFIRRRIAYLDAQWLTPGCILGIDLSNDQVYTGTVFPNPTTSEFNYNITLNNAANVTIEVGDLTGRTLLTKNWNNLSSGNQQLNINLANLPNGVYFMKAKIGNDFMQTHKIFKQ